MSVFVSHPSHKWDYRECVCRVCGISVSGKQVQEPCKDPNAVEEPPPAAPEPVGDAPAMVEGLEDLPDLASVLAALRKPQKAKKKLARRAAVAKEPDLHSASLQGARGLREDDE